jgi:hypothetical protein
MKTKCEPGDKLKFPDGTEWLFIGYFDDVAMIASHHDDDDPKIRVTSKCCTPKLHELTVTESPAHSPADPQKI